MHGLISAKAEAAVSHQKSDINVLDKKSRLADIFHIIERKKSSREIFRFECNAANIQDSLLLVRLPTQLCEL